MKLEYQNCGDYWTATGDGPLRPIVAEGNSRAEARMAWMHIYGNQYADEQVMSRPRLVETYDDIRTTNYQGEK